MPEQVFERIKMHIKKEWLICFVSALLFGLLAHGYKIANWLPNWDSLVFRYDAMEMTHFGRIFLSAACGISSYYDLPWLNGLLSILYTALGAVCICEMFSLKKNVTLILTGGLVAAFPSVTSVMAYSFTADGYFLAFFFACLACALMVKGGKKSLFSVVLLVFSLGIYQAYLSTAMMLLLFYLLDELVFGRDTRQEFLKKTGRFLCCGGCSVILYGAAVQLVLKVKDVKLSEYQGIKSAFSLSDIHILYSVKQCVKRLLSFFFDFSQGFSLFTILNTVIVVLLAFFLVHAMCSRGIRRHRWRTVFLCLGLCCIPFVGTALYFAEPGVDYHNLMLMGYCVIYLSFVFLYERTVSNRKAVQAVKQWAILLASGLLLYNFVLIANISYHKLQLAYEKSSSIALRIADRIDWADSGKECEKIAILGCLPDSTAYSSVLPPDITGVTDGTILLKSAPVIGQNILLSMLEDYCAVDYEDSTPEEAEKLRKLPEVKKMQAWPSESSVKKIGNTVVVYLGEENF